MWVSPLGWEGPVDEGKATHSSILAWRIPWTEEPGRLQPMGSDMTQRHTQCYCSHIFVQSLYNELTEVANDRAKVFKLIHQINQSVVTGSLL